MVKYLLDRIEEIVGLAVLVLGIIGLVVVWDKDIATLFLIAGVLGLILATGGRTERLLKELKELTKKKGEQS